MLEKYKSNRNNKQFKNIMETDYLFECKNLYLKSIHPFDLKKTNENKKIIEIGIELINKNGIQHFAGFLMESQYRVYIWTSRIILEYGNLNPNEILEISYGQTIKDVCLENIVKNEIDELPKEVMKNKTEWLIKTGYNNQYKQ